MKQLIVGNWKMNLVSQQVIDLIEHIQPSDKAEIVVCPAFPYLSLARHVLTGSPILLGAQDCHPKEQGAYTGNVSAAMLKDMGCSYAIIGHSECRQYHQETNRLVQEKAQAALSLDLKPIICIGETDEENQNGRTEQVLTKQIQDSIPDNQTGDELVIAYEPVWAIGTGRTPTYEEIEKVHAFIRAELRKRVKDPSGVQILYGGSVKGDNADKILHCPDVNGVLVGGASLKAEEFNRIIQGAKAGS